MRPAYGRQTCDCCGNLGKAEFVKIIEFKDAGIALYRYWPQTEDGAQIGTETGEVLILRNIRDVDLKIEELTAKAGKKTISCPRCIKMIERAKSLFTDLPPAKIREVAGICDHCYQKELFPCPCCDKVVNKFLKFSLEEKRKTQEYRQLYKSWLSKSQQSLKKSVTNIKDGKLEPQAPLSRYIPTMTPQHKHIEEKPTRVLSFLDFSEEEKLRVKVESELDREKKKSLAEENEAKALKSVSFDDFSKTDLEPTLIKVNDIKVISPTEKDKPSTPIMDEHIKAQPTMEQDIKTTTVMQQMIRPKLEIEKYRKPTPLTKKYTKHQSLVEKEFKLKSIMKKGSVKKPPHDVFLKDDTTPRGKRKLQSSPTTITSFETIIKTMSEPNVSNFRYTFPRDKIVTTDQLKGHVSSSELIRITQDMIDERKETERKKKEETRRKRGEKKEQKTAEKTNLLKEESEQREEGRLLEEERKKHEEVGVIKSEERIGKLSDQLAQQEIYAQEKIKKRQEKQHDTEATTALKEVAKQAKEGEELGNQHEKVLALLGKRAKKVEKQLTTEELKIDKKIQHPEAKSGEDEDIIGKGPKEKKKYQGQEKSKQRDEMQSHAKATTALKEVAKQAKEGEELGNQHEKVLALLGKRAKKVEKQLTTEELKIDKKIQHPEAKSGEDEDIIGKGPKEKKIDQGQEKSKQRGEMQSHAKATTALKEQMAKQAKDKSEEEKLRKQQDKDEALKEKKAKEADNQLTTEKLTIDKKTEHPQAKSGEDEDTIGKAQKEKKYDQGQEKSKQRDEMQSNAKATTALKEQMAKQAKDKSEEEKLRKQQDKDEALKEKKAKEAHKQLTTEKLTIDKKTEHPQAKSGEDEDIIGKAQKEKKNDQGQEKSKQRGEMQSHAKATTALKEQMAKQAKDKSEEEKLRKQQEKDEALKEKIAKQADKVFESTQKELSTGKKQAKRLSELMVDDKETRNTKDGKAKAEPVKATADQKAKGPDMALLLREQLAKQKQEQLEKEKIRKQQEKERELIAKKLKEIEIENAAKKAAIKAPVLEPDHSVDEISTDFTMLPNQDEVTDIIIGQKIFNVKCAKKTEDDKTPILELEQSQKQGQHSEQITAKQEPELHKHSELSSEGQYGFTKGLKPGPPTLMQSQQKSSTKVSEEPNKGIIKYTLSDRTFIEKGWTMLPTEKVVRKMNVYRMRPAKPEFDWFEHNKNKGLLTYDSGEKFAEFDENGRGRWYYRTGRLALDYYDAEETNAGQRFVVYSTGQPDERGRSRPRTLLATFDYSGNGIVFDHTGKIRLKYNQTEGVVLDRTIGPVSHWKWHTLNDPPVLQQVMIDTQMPYKDPTILAMGDKQADAKRPDNEEMLAIEFENFLKEKRQKVTQSQSFKPFQIKMKALKINENFSLRVLDQASIYLLFRDGTTNLKLNIGMVLDHKEIVDTDTAEIGEVSNTLDKLPACTDSIAGLQKAVAKVQAQERLRVRHELRLKPPQPSASADALRAGCSRPLRTPIVQASLSSRDKMTPKRFKPSSSCNLYYSTQLF
ncbi:trichohyalin-like [Cydia fagiglandana]|uniref:trichohyalin-like n=1 Tax=Cydia fagiglandana TaxID=1458189 RepID=UPI002FEE2CBF